jgi:hypothetical protein
MNISRPVWWSRIPGAQVMAVDRLRRVLGHSARMFVAVTAALACSALLTGFSPGAAHLPAAVRVRADLSDDGWGTAEQVSGAATPAGVTSVSCVSAGNCSAGGWDEGEQAFVVDETDGTWGAAQTVAGAADGGAEITSVSCSSPGNCSAGGWDEGEQAFVVDETDGTWGTALAIASGGQVNSVSCSSAGNCSAGGTYTDNSGGNLAFVVDETDGTWGAAQEIATDNDDGDTIYSVSCSSAGNCGAGGETGSDQAFVVDETDGTWGAAQEIADGTAGGGAEVTSVSCTSAGNCGAGGADGEQAFVVDEIDGTWGDVQALAGTSGETAEVRSVSCSSAGNCSAGGDGDQDQAFVVDETNGTWRAAQEVAGAGDNSDVSSVSCSSAGNCSAGGAYYTGPAFVVDETDGTWGGAQAVAGEESGSGITTVSCSSAGNCSAGGINDYSSGEQAFVVSESAGPVVTGLAPSAGPPAGATTVTITGSGFTGATAVMFGSVAAADFTVDSDTQITATSPAQPAGTGDVTVTGPNGGSPPVPADQFTYAPTVVTGVAPPDGPPAGATTVTITGSGFTGATAVMFGSVAAADFTVDSDTQITATSPAQPAGTGDVTVTGPNGGSPPVPADQFTYTAPSAPSFTGGSCAVTALFGAPTSYTLRVLGLPIPTITKSGALPSGVRFTNDKNGTAAISGTPSDKAAGPYPLTVTAKNSHGTTTLACTLTVTKSPAVDKIPPTTATIGTPLNLTITAPGYPTPALTESRPLPTGLTFTDNRNGTATLSGTPAIGSRGTYPITVTATNAPGTASTTFKLKIDPAPAPVGAADRWRGERQ